MTAQPTRIETEAERAFREGAEALIASVPAAEAGARRAALAAFTANGLPDRRREEFHYTDIRGKLRNAYPPVTKPATQTVRLTVGRDDLGEVVDILDGQAASGADVETEGVREGDSLDALNTAVAPGGARVRVERGEKRTIVLDHTIIADLHGKTSVHPRHTIEVDEGAHLTLIEHHWPSEDHLTNEQLYFSLAEGSRLDHIKLLSEGDAVHLAGVYGNIGANATYQALTLAFDTRLVRHAVAISLRGRGASAAVRSIALITGDEHVDFSMRADHEAADCRSEQETRIVALGSARGVAQSLVRVAPHARGSDARQMIRGLILSPKAEIDAKPELEILNDDVKASHGTALGDLDPEAIFYLRSRGVPEGEARALLAEAFIAEILSGIAHAGARELLLARAGSWLAQAFGGGDG